MSDEKRDILLKVFGNLKEKVLWKWEKESMPNQPANVMLHKWLPQQGRIDTLYIIDYTTTLQHYVRNTIGRCSRFFFFLTTFQNKMSWVIPMSNYLYHTEDNPAFRKHCAIRNLR